MDDEEDSDDDDEQNGDVRCVFVCACVVCSRRRMFYRLLVGSQQHSIGRQTRVPPRSVDRF